MTIEIRHLRRFLMVAEELNFTRASERLHLAQPALSTQIRKMEEELGVTLFRRNTRSVVLTDEGERFADRARAAVLAYDSALGVVAPESTGISAQVTLAHSTRFPPQSRIAIRARLGQIDPTVIVDFVAGSASRVMGDVALGQVDAALCVAPRNVASTLSTMIRDEPLAVALPSTHPLADGRSLALADLRQEAWILPSNSISAAGDLLRAVCRQAGFELVPAGAVADYDEEFFEVSRGTAIEVVPRSFIRDPPPAGVVFAALVEGTLPVCVLWRADAQNSAQSALIRAVVEAGSDASAWLRRGIDLDHG